jgi:hypothetical protein
MLSRKPVFFKLCTGLTVEEFDNIYNKDIKNMLQTRVKTRIQKKRSKKRKKAYDEVDILS